MRKLVSAESVTTGRGRLGNAILIEAGRVVAVGDHADLAMPDMVEERYPGAHIVPGLRDAHIHAVPYAALLSGCSLKSSTSIDDLVQRLASYAETLPEGAPVVATRMDDEHLSERRLPTRHDLDRAVPDRPAVIYRYCGHVAVANSVALIQSGLTADTPDPDGGSLDRDETGAPNGILRETASGLIASALSRGGPLEPEQLIHGLNRLAALGLTSIGAMIGYGESPSEKLEAEIELWTSVGRQLPIKVHGIVITDDPHALEASASALNRAGPRIGWLGVKRFADGSLGGHTAAMNEPFADVDTLGTYRLTEADHAIAAHTTRLGGMVCIHAIGDRAVTGVLDVFDRLIEAGADPASLRMEHVSVADPALLRRFADTGVTACVQPAFLASESEWLVDRVGEERRPWLYPFRSMLDLGIPMAGSSDSPVEPPHPLWGIAAAVDRHGISPDEALGNLDALALFTSGAAKALREPEPLSAGSPADFVVLDVDLATAEAQDIHDAVVLDTFVDGDPVELDRSLAAWVD